MNSYNLMKLLISLAIPFFIILILFTKQIRKATFEAKRQLPPGPKKLPIIGNLHQLGKLPHRSLQHLSKKYGDLMFLQLGSVPTLVVSSTDAAREIFKTHDVVLSGRPTNYTSLKYTYNSLSVAFSPYGEHWREMRKILIMELLSSKRVKSFEAIRSEEVSFMIDSIAKASAADQPINLSDLALSLANKIVCRVAFGHGRDNKQSKFVEILHDTLDLLGTASAADFFPRLAWLNKFNGLDKRVDKNFRKLDSFFDEVIAEHLDSKRPKLQHEEDVVDVMLRLQKDPNQRISLKNDHIKGVLADIFIAGSDTSAVSLVWTMAELIKNPTVMEKAQREVREAVKVKGKVEESDVSKLDYLKMVIKESLRLHPPAPLLNPRETLEDCRVQGYEIPAKTRVFINATTISTDEKYWDNPYEFQPERFLDNSIDFRGQNFELIPFGVGRRGCPGINFAIPLLELALANLLYCFDWTLPNGLMAKDLDMEEAMGITVQKRTPLYLLAYDHI